MRQNVLRSWLTDGGFIADGSRAGAAVFIAIAVGMASWGAEAQVRNSDQQPHIAGSPRPQDNPRPGLGGVVRPQDAVRPGYRPGAFREDDRRCDGRPGETRPGLATVPGCR